MLVSFVIVAYNAEKFLKKSLNCLLEQNYNLKKIEVILVDSFSSDNTKKIMQTFKKSNAKKFNRISIFDNSKKTLPCGWNVALRELKGEVVLRVDAHTSFGPDFITNNVEEIKKGEDIVGGKCISVVQNDTWKENLLLMAEESIFGCGIADFRRKEEREYVSTLAFAMYRKKVFDDVGFYNEKLARTEDNEMHYRMKQKGYKFLLSPKIQTHRFARSNLKEMVKQKYGNGKWIGITLRYCPKCFSIYHFAPLIFVLGILFSVVMSFVGFPIFLYLLFGAYILFNILNLILVCINYKFKLYILLLPFILFILHFCYGIGTLFGIFSLQKKGLNDEKK